MEENPLGRTLSPDSSPKIPYSWNWCPSYLLLIASYNCFLEISFVFKECVHLLLYRPKGHDSVKGKNTLGKSLWIPNAAWTVSPVVRAQPALDLWRRNPSVMWRKRKVSAIAFSTLNMNTYSCRKEKVVECYEKFCPGKSSVRPNIWKRPPFLDCFHSVFPKVSCGSPN